MNMIHKTIQVTTEPGGRYIIIKFVGDLVESDVEQFKKDLESATNALIETYQKKGDKLHILLDMTDFTGNYSLDALNALTAFAAKNSTLVEKTASFGGSDKVKAAGEIVTTLAHRSNIKIFDKEADAVAWILS